MNETITKKDLLESLLENSLLENKKLIAVCKTGSRLYNLSTEKSDYDFTVIYLPSKEDIYFNCKDVLHFKLECKGNLIEGKLLSLKGFINDLGKPSLNSLEILYDEQWFVEGFKQLYAADYFLNIYCELKASVNSLFYLKKGDMFNTLKGHLFNRTKNMLKSNDPAKEYMNFVRIYNILKALHADESMKEYVLTDGSLLSLRRPENSLTKDEYLIEMDKVLTTLKDTDYALSFNKKCEYNPLKGYHILLMEGLFN